MEFNLQAFGPFLHWLTLIVLIIMPVLVAYVVYRLGSLPGEIARARNHPQANGRYGPLTAVMAWGPVEVASPPPGDAEGRFSTRREKQTLGS